MHKRRPVDFRTCYVSRIKPQYRDRSYYGGGDPDFYEEEDWDNIADYIGGPGDPFDCGT